MTAEGEAELKAGRRFPLDARLTGAALTIVVFLWSWIFLGQSFYARHANTVGQNHDTVVYQGYALEMRAGKLPYRDFPVVYPPGGLPMFLSPTYLVQSGDLTG